MPFDFFDGAQLAEVNGGRLGNACHFSRFKIISDCSDAKLK